MAKRTQSNNGGSRNNYLRTAAENTFKKYVSNGRIDAVLQWPEEFETSGIIPKKRFKKLFGKLNEDLEKMKESNKRYVESFSRQEGAITPLWYKESVRTLVNAYNEKMKKAWDSISGMRVGSIQVNDSVEDAANNLMDHLAVDVMNGGLDNLIAASSPKNSKLPSLSSPNDKGLSSPNDKESVSSEPEAPMPKKKRVKIVLTKNPRIKRLLKEVRDESARICILSSFVLLVSVPGSGLLTMGFAIQFMFLLFTLGVSAVILRLFRSLRTAVGGGRHGT